MPKIHENYRSYVPPAWLRPTVERLLSSLAPEHVGGLESVVLRDSAAVGKGRTVRVSGRKYARSECRGFYHAKSRTGGAWIEVIADNIDLDWPKWLLSLQLHRDMLVSEVLYHEIGHHLDDTVGAATRRGEAAAEDWHRRLSRIHFRKRYAFLRPVAKVIRVVARVARRMLKWRGK